MKDLIQKFGKKRVVHAVKQLAKYAKKHGIKKGQSQQYIFSNVTAEGKGLVSTSAVPTENGGRWYDDEKGIPFHYLKGRYVEIL